MGKPLNELQTAWLEALESGKYPQSSGFLKCDKGYCCLGVLADTLPGVEWRPWGHPRANGEGVPLPYQGDENLACKITGEPLETYSLYDGYLSPSVLARVDITLSKSIALTGMNDAGVEFPAIANWLKKLWSGQGYDIPGCGPTGRGELTWTR